MQSGYDFKVSEYGVRCIQKIRVVIIEQNGNSSELSLLTALTSRPHVTSCDRE